MQGITIMNNNIYICKCCCLTQHCNYNLDYSLHLNYLCYAFANKSRCFINSVVLICTI